MALLLSFWLSIASAQKEKITSTYLTFQYTHTIHDLTKGNNPWSIGSGIRLFFNTRSFVRPVIELTGDVYLQSDKTLRIDRDQITPPVGGVIKLLAGPSFQIGRSLNLSLIAGPAYVNSRLLLTLSPDVSLVTKNQKVFFKIAYIHILNRGNLVRDVFTSYSFGSGLKLF